MLNWLKIYMRKVLYIGMCTFMISMFFNWILYCSLMFV